MVTQPQYTLEEALTVYRLASPLFLEEKQHVILVARILDHLPANNRKKFLETTPIYISDRVTQAEGLSEEFLHWCGQHPQGTLWVELLVSRNDVPEDVLRNFAHNENDIIRQKVASNIRTPASVLESLSKETGGYSIEIRMAVASNENTSEETLLRLSTASAHPQVRAAALATLQRLY